MSIKIFIDQGHNPSGVNAGAEGNGLREQDITYAVGIYLAELLRSDGRFEVRLSRNYPEQSLGTSNASSLEARVRMANTWPADYFLSIHCNANVNPEINGTEMYVYRMTMTTADGTVVEVPWETVEVWCDKLGVKHVPDLEKFIFTTPEDLKERANKYLNGMPADEIGKTHIAEGVVVRIDNRATFTAYKDKVFEFKVIESIIKDTSDVPDMEEAEELINEVLDGSESN